MTKSPLGAARQSLAGRLVLAGAVCIAATLAFRGAAVRTGRASTGPEDGAAAGIIVLAKGDVSGALRISGSGTLKTPIAFVNSSSASAVKVTGSGDIDAVSLQVMGGATLGAGSKSTGKVVQFPGPALDPKASLSAVCAGLTAGMTDGGSISVSSNKTKTVAPGYYSKGISIASGAKVTFSPGVYIVDKELKISNCTITGEGVCFVVQSGPVTVHNSAVTLTPPTSGTFTGIVLAQRETNTSDLTVDGGSDVSISGTIWAPAASASLGGNANVSGKGPILGDMLVVKQLDVTGSGLLTIGRAQVPVVAPQVSNLYD